MCPPEREILNADMDSEVCQHVLKTCAPTGLQVRFLLSAFGWILKRSTRLPLEGNDAGLHRFESGSTHSVDIRNVSIGLKDISRRRILKWLKGQDLKSCNAGFREFESHSAYNKTINALSKAHQTFISCFLSILFTQQLLQYW